MQVPWGIGNLASYKVRKRFLCSLDSTDLKDSPEEVEERNGDRKVVDRLALFDVHLCKAHYDKVLHHSCVQQARKEGCQWPWNMIERHSSCLGCSHAQNQIHCCHCPSCTASCLESRQADFDIRPFVPPVREETEMSLVALPGDSHEVNNMEVTLQNLGCPCYFCWEYMVGACLPGVDDCVERIRDVNGRRLVEVVVGRRLQVSTNEMIGTDQVLVEGQVDHHSSCAGS